MNQEKAREFFSAYYEGTLEPGLRQTLEQRLRADSALRDEFREFERTIEEIDSLRFEEINPPADLHERIASRIEKHIQEHRAASQPSWVSWARNAAVAGIAAAAIVGALFSYLNHGQAATASAIPGPNAESMRFSLKDGGRVVLDYAPSSEKTVIVHDGVNGQELNRFDLGPDKPLNSPLVNDNESTALFGIEILGEPTGTLVAVPGTARVKESSGQGTLQDFAKALAGFYRVPVEVDSKNLADPITWDFSGTSSAREAAAGALSASQYGIEQRESGFLRISDN